MSHATQLSDRPGSVGLSARISDLRRALLGGVERAAGTRAAWIAFAVLMLAGMALYFQLSGAAQDLVYDLFAATALVSIVIGVRIHQPADRRPWRLLGAFLLCSLLGDITYFVYENVLGIAAPFPSLADAFYLAQYPLATAAVLLFMAPRLGRRGWRGTLDVGLLTLAAAVVSWIVLMQPYANDPALSLLGRMVALGYPAMDLLIFAAVARLMLAGASRAIAFYALVAAFGMRLCADWIYSFILLSDTYRSGLPVDAGWLAGYALLAAAALHPSMARIGAPQTREAAKRTPTASAVFGLAALAPPGLMAGYALAEGSLAMAALALAAVAFTFLIARHLAGATRDSSRLSRLVYRSEARFGALVKASSDVFVIASADGVVSYESPAVERVLAQPSSRPGDRLERLVHPEDHLTVARLLASAMAKPTAEAAAEWRMRHADGSWKQIAVVATDMTHDEALRGIVLTYRDVTEQRKLENRLRHNAFHDPLTDLPNRSLLADRLRQALRGRDGTRPGVAALLIDVDDFKTVNDALGHSHGDEVLRSVARRFSLALRPGDTLARLGGDEFAVVLVGLRDVGEAQVVAQRIVDALRAPITVAGTEVFLSTSVGIALANSPEQPGDELLRNADVAMYAAKKRGKARFEVFVPAMQTATSRRLELIGALQRAVASEQFFLEYQPVVRLATGEMTSVEALIRWHRPEHGVVSPGEFIPLAEETGLIVPIGEWVLTTACRQARLWQLADPQRPRIALNVNLSVRQLQHPELLRDVAAALRESGLRPEDLVLEITESDLMREVDAGVETLRALRQMGVRIAIDDFGTGYSSLSYLSRLPADVLKIDRSFVKTISGEPEAAVLTKAMVRLGQTLGMEVVPEGIETSEQLETLREWGCDTGQGFFLGRPAPPDVIGALLRVPATAAVGPTPKRASRPGAVVPPIEMAIGHPAATS